MTFNRHPWNTETFKMLRNNHSLWGSYFNPEGDGWLEPLTRLTEAFVPHVEDDQCHVAGAWVDNSTGGLRFMMSWYPSKELLVLTQEILDELLRTCMGCGKEGSPTDVSGSGAITRVVCAECEPSYREYWDGQKPRSFEYRDTSAADRTNDGLVKNWPVYLDDEYSTEVDDDEYYEDEEYPDDYPDDY